MSDINVNYGDLQKKSQKLYTCNHGDNGLAYIANNLQGQIDVIAKAWVDKNHYEQLNALEKECNTLRQYINIVERFQILLQTTADEYKATQEKNVGLANKSV